MMEDTLTKYFGDWLKVINKDELYNVVNRINIQYKTKSCQPDYKNIFKVFNITPFDNLKQVWLLQDPYPQKGVATGIALGNKQGTLKLSPSLEVIKESVINFEIPHNYITFDTSLEEWSKQGILLLNTALTVETNKPGSHSMIWRKFIIELLKNLTLTVPGLIYILWGNSAKSFESYIGKCNDVFKMNHPAYYARTQTKIPYKFFTDLNELTEYKFGERITFYKENKYEEVSN